MGSISQPCFSLPMVWQLPCALPSDSSVTRVRWLHPGSGSAAEFSWTSWWSKCESPLETHFTLCLILLRSVLPWVFPFPLLHTLFHTGLGPLLSPVWQALQSFPLLHCWSCLRFYFTTPRSQRGSKQRAARPPCRHHVLQPFKLRCWDASREGLGSATLSAALPRGTTSRVIQWTVGVSRQELPELAYQKFRVVLVSTDGKGHFPFSSDLHWWSSVGTPLIYCW